jgi:hypothetical protein
MCAVPGCEQKYTAAGANATRTRNHIAGAGGGVARCLKSTVADKAAAAAHAPAPAVAPRAQLGAPTDNPAIAESAAGVSRGAAAAGPSGNAGVPELLLTPKRRKLLDDAQGRGERVALEPREPAHRRLDRDGDGARDPALALARALAAGRRRGARRL